MSDMRDAMKKAGLKLNSGERQCTDCGRPFTPREPKHRRCPECAKAYAGRSGSRSPAFPDGYPDYFDADGNLKCEYVTDLAQTIAAHLGQERQPQMTTHQLRAFYSHVKRLESSMSSDRPFKEIYPDICKLKPFAEERSAKGKIPRYFVEFICRNVDKAIDQKSFQSGFIEHFQALVAYCAGTIQTR
jgi:CRISPR type III-A-associated protein Csm2